MMKKGKVALLAGSAVFYGILAPGSAAVAQVAPAAAPAPTPTPPIASASSPAPSNQGAGEIVVTAQRRSERARDVPISLTVQSAEQLQTKGIGQLRELEVVTPGLSTARNGNNFQPAIRGVTSVDSNPGNDPNVSLYIDGVYRPNATANFVDLPDVDRIEVLKGPQGTLFGRNATGGAIRIETRKPTFDFTGDLQASYGSFDDKTVQGFVSVPIVDQIAAFSVSGLYEKSDGYLHDAITGKRFGGVDTKFIHAKLLLQPTDRLTVLISGEYIDRQDDSAGSQPANGNTVARGLPGVVIPTDPYVISNNRLTGTQQDLGGVHNKSWITSGQATLDLGWSTLTSLTSYSHYNLYSQSEADFTNSPVSIYYTTGFERTFNQELNLASTGNGRLKWVAGLTYYDDSARYDPLAVISPAYTVNVYGKQDTKAYAGFGEVTYTLLPGLSVIGGLRYSHEKRTLFGSFNTGTFPKLADSSFHSFTPRVSLRYAITNDTNIYVTYSKGFKSGGYTVSSLSTAAFAPEKLNAFEVGVKSAPSRSFSINAAGYYYIYSNQQVQAAVTLPNGAIVGQTINAASSRMYGLELDATARPTSELTFSAAFSWLHARFKSFPNALVQTPRTIGGVVCNCGNVTSVVDVSGNQLIRSPDFTVSATAEYVKPIGRDKVGASATVYLTDRFSYTFDDRVKQPSYETLNARIFWRMANGLELAVWGKNLTDSVYYQGASILPGGDGLFFAPPRSYGVEARFHF
jgi:iron complex outermembrane receptor protein